MSESDTSVVKNGKGALKRSESDSKATGDESSTGSVTSSNSKSGSGSGSESGDSTGSGTGDSSDSSSDEEGEQSKSSEDSFRTVHDTTIVNNKEVIETVRDTKVVEKKSTASRSKSASPGNVVPKQGQSRASSSPLIKTPGKSMTSPKNKTTPKHTPLKPSPLLKSNKVIVKHDVVTPPLEATTQPPDKAVKVPETKAEVKKAAVESSPASSNDKKRKHGSTKNKTVSQRKESKDKEAVKSVERPVESGKAGAKVSTDKIEESDGAVHEAGESSTSSKDKKKARKKDREKENRIKRGKHSSTSESDEPKAFDASVKIAKVPPEKRFQKIAISRAKLCGLIKDGQIRIVQITEALKIIDQVKFNLLPTHVFRHYYKCPGVGLPHIRRHLRVWKRKYQSLIAVMAKMHLNMALAAEKKKLSLLGPELDNEYRSVWLFEKEVQCTEPAKPGKLAMSGGMSTPTAASPPQKKARLDNQVLVKAKHGVKGAGEKSDDITPKTSRKRVKNKKSKKSAKSAKKSKKE